ncbi:MAG: hypothetical protein WB779_11585, partial [Ignavibacteriaceae bacterium]
SMFLSDSSWRDTLEITFNYDEYGRIIQMGQFTWFHYNPDGNLDSMVITHTFSSGYLANKGTFVILMEIVLHCPLTPELIISIIVHLSLA